MNKILFVLLFVTFFGWNATAQQLEIQSPTKIKTKQVNKNSEIKVHLSSGGGWAAIVTKLNHPVDR